MLNMKGCPFFNTVKPRYSKHLKNCNIVRYIQNSQFKISLKIDAGAVQFS